MLVGRQRALYAALTKTDSQAEQVFAEMALITSGSNCGFELNFRAEVNEVLNLLNEADAGAIPYLTASALSATAYEARSSEQLALNASFDRPTPFTKRAVLYRKATARDLTATVFIRDEAPGGVAPARYLEPEIVGGPRRAKSHELRLRRAGIMRADEFAVPGDDVPLDAYGNIKGGTFEQMLSQLGAAEQFAGYSANETRRSRRRAGARRSSRFFVSDGGGLLPRGIFERTGRKGVRSFLLFVSGAPGYRSRYRFGQAARVKAERVFGDHFVRYFNRFIETGKIRFGG